MTEVVWISPYVNMYLNMLAAVTIAVRPSASTSGTAPMCASCNNRRDELRQRRNDSQDLLAREEIALVCYKTPLSFACCETFFRAVCDLLEHCSELSSRKVHVHYCKFTSRKFYKSQSSRNTGGWQDNLKSAHQRQHNVCGLSKRCMS